MLSRVFCSLLVLASCLVAHADGTLDRIHAVKEFPSIGTISKPILVLQTSSKAAIANAVGSLKLGDSVSARLADQVSTFCAELQKKIDADAGGHDLASALSLCTITHTPLIGLGEPRDDSTQKVANQLRQIIGEVADKKAGSELYNWCLAHASLTLVLAIEAGTDEKAKTFLQARAKAILAEIYGVNSEKLVLTDAGLSFKSAKTEATNPLDLFQWTIGPEWQTSNFAGGKKFIHPKTDTTGEWQLLVLAPIAKSKKMRDLFPEVYEQVRKAINPGEEVQKPLPLFLTSKNGAVIAYDGQRTGKQTVMVYCIECENQMVPIVGIFQAPTALQESVDASSNQPTALASTISQILNSIVVPNWTAKYEFEAKDLIGSFKQVNAVSLRRNVDSATGKYVGDASSGLSTSYTFGADGHFTGGAATVANGKGATAKASQGTWKIAGNQLVLKSAAGTEQIYRLMGCGTLPDGKRAFYVLNPKFVDRWLLEMMVQGSSVASYRFTEVSK